MANAKISNSQSKEQEIWEQIPGYKEYYQVSNLGRVRSLDREYFVDSEIKGKYTGTIRGRILKQSIVNGYKRVTLFDNQHNKKGVNVHRIVLIAFVGKSDLVCNHKDGNKENNCLDNLEWVTQAYNNRHARIEGLNNMYGENHHQAKLTKDDVIEIRHLYESKDIKQNKLAKMFDVSATHINRIVHNKCWLSV